LTQTAHHCITPGDAGQIANPIARRDLSRDEPGKSARSIAAELRRRRWTEDDLICRREGDPEKIRIAMRLRQQSAMSLKWIAERLRMGAWTDVSNLLVQQRKKSR
jgi:hypothetical protein